MANKDRWWDKEEETPSESAGSTDSKQDVEGLLNEAEKNRVKREEELAKAEHDYKVAQFDKKRKELMPETGTQRGPGEHKIRATSNGMYRTNGTINGRDVTFLVDTGATNCAMSTKIAEYVGGKPGKSYWSSTANGRARSFELPLDEVRVGEIVVRNVMGASGEGMHDDYVLLGMSFLNEIEMDIDDDVMTLRQNGSDRDVQEGKKGVEDGVLGLWWLSPGEAVSIGIAAMIAIFFFGMGAVVMAGEPVYESTAGVVLEGTEWWESEYEHEDCAYDEYNDVYYDCYYWYEYECGADVQYFFDVDGAEFRSQGSLFLGTWSDYCLEFAEDIELPIGSSVTVWYNVDNPEDSSLDEPLGMGILFFCCGPIFLLILIVTLVNARFSNGPKTGWGTDFGIQFNSGGGYHGGPQGHGGRYWGPRWGPRIRFGGPSRRVHTSRRRGGRSSGGRSSSGGRRR